MELACACLVGPFKAFLQVSEGLLAEPVYCLCTLYISQTLLPLAKLALQAVCAHELLSHLPKTIRWDCMPTTEVCTWAPSSVVSRSPGVASVSFVPDCSCDWRPGRAVTQQLSSESSGVQNGDNMHTHLPTLRRGGNLRPLNTRKDWRRFYNW